MKEIEISLDLRSLITMQVEVSQGLFRMHALHLHYSVGLITARQRSCGKVMFSEVFCLSTGRGVLGCHFLLL